MANNLQARFASVARRMHAEFIASTYTVHHGSKGTEREEILQRVLQLYLPGNVEVVHNAEVISASGEVSPQCDILIIDNKAPRLQDLKSHRIVPAECVYCVIEVKSKLNGPELAKACNNIKRVKQIPRTAFIGDPSCFINAGRTSYAIQPIEGAIFAYDSNKLDNLAPQLGAAAIPPIHTQTTCGLMTRDFSTGAQRMV
jgi:hypothetical protein